MSPLVSVASDLLSGIRHAYICNELLCLCSNHHHAWLAFIVEHFAYLCTVCCQLALHTVTNLLT